jgi:hypothetical protein
MHYQFDLLSYAEEDFGLIGRLGLDRILVLGRDVHMAEGAAFDLGKRYLVNSGNQKILSRAVKNPSVAGIIFEGREMMPLRAIQDCAREEKVILFPCTDIVSAMLSGDFGRIYSIRKAAAMCMRENANACAVTMAPSREGLLSAAQLAAMNEFIGIEKGRYEKSVSAFGELVDS